MSIPYTQATMAQVRAVDGTFISHPFLEIGDTATKVYNLLCTQRASDYDSAQIALDAPMTNATTAGVISLPSGWADSTAYFVGDTGHSAIDGGMIQFNRTFANIPAYSRITRGSYGYTFPGLNNFTEETAQSSDISAISMALGTVGIRVITDDTMTLSVGDKLDLSLKYKDAGDDFVNVIYGEAFVLSVINTNTFNIDIGRYFYEQTTLELVSGSVEKPATAGRPPLNQQGQLTETTTYILPGVTDSVASSDDVIMPQKFSPLNITVTTGEPSVYTRVNTLTDTTWPTAGEYLTMMKNGESIIVDSSLQEWRGNILQQTIKTVKAL